MNGGTTFGGASASVSMGAGAEMSARETAPTARMREQHRPRLRLGQSESENSAGYREPGRARVEAPQEGMGYWPITSRALLSKLRA